MCRKGEIMKEGKKATTFALEKETLVLLKKIAEADLRNQSYEIEFLIQERAKVLGFILEP
jgi:hypothetical protein